MSEYWTQLNKAITPFELTDLIFLHLKHIINSQSSQGICP